MADTGYRQLRTSRANDVLGTIARTFSYISKHFRYRFILAIIFTILSSLATVISSYMFTPIINNHIVPYIGVENPDMSGFIRMLWLMVAIYASGMLSSYAFIGHAQKGDAHGRALPSLSPPERQDPAGA